MPTHRRVFQRISEFFSAYQAEEADARRFRARQIEAVLRLTPVAMFINLLNALVIDLALWPTGHHRVLLVWTIALTLLVALGLRGWATSRRRGERLTASVRALRRATAHASLLGAAWGILPALLLPALDSGAQFHLGLVVTGMICAGGFVLASIPQAASAYVIATGVGATYALWYSGIAQSHLFAILLVGYCALVLYSVWATAKTFGARLVAESHAERQNEVIGLLLKDFEDHASDLLWELDARGRFAHVSPRLAQVLGVTEQMLMRNHAWTVIRELLPHDDAGANQWAALRVHIADRRSFRDLHVALRGERGTTWWALSARPLFDDRDVLTGWRGVATDVTDKQIAHRRLSWLANNDSLTGLVNRHQFRELLRSLLHGSNAIATPLAVICFDLDDFKHINDSRGHAAGDRLLAIAGQRLLSVARRTDTVARLGGDEFAIVLRGVSNPDVVRSTLQRVLAALNEPCDVLGETEKLRASIGVAMAPMDGMDVDTLLSHADLALYAAKQAGGNQYQFFHASLADVSRRRAALAQALRGAVERRELRLEYQAQVSADGCEICGFEALLRWSHAEHGEVPPAEFVPIAEDAGLMHDIGEWVMRTACEAAVHWPRHLSLSINVSATQLTHAGFVERVSHATRAMRPGRVELEVTESALIDDADAAVGALRKLRALGFRSALDDFGTGYSALGYLRRFPFDTLKIDRSFVRDLSRDGEAQVLVETILAMARALQMRAIAEGVENLAEASMLSERGCAALQGYLVSRPLPEDQVLDFLSGWSGAPLRGIANTAVA